MDYETLMNIQGYAKFFITLFIFIVFFSYAYSLYKRDRTGETNFEKYAGLVHDDSIDSSPLETNIKEDKEKKEK
ncbi:MAG: CcoQ/FixQ family Cbb3-type cytochrome c oxidase assembly chaperone [Arcobacteraceae bacterium]|nr:CcoQ/FixQ family Cbb3-type cytochrome c oxidase assembly chaperone [Arcobacteraceae bacterium]